MNSSKDKNLFWSRFVFQIFLFLFVFNNANPTLGQTIFYQDVCNCGISGAGGTFGPTSGIIHFNLNISNISTIKKAFLFAGSDGNPNGIVLNLNGIDYSFTDQDVATTGFLTRFDLTNPKSSIYAKEITSFINPNIQDYYLTIPNQNYITKNIFTTYYLCVIYEDNSLTKSAFSLVLNQKDVSSVMAYSINNLFPISNIFDVGLSLVGWYFCNISDDGSYVNINTNNIGLVGGNDSNSINHLCTGTQGHFYYQNNQLFGLDDDTPDAVMGGSDALANIQNYVSNNATSLNITLNYQSPLNEDGSRSNPVLGFFLSYSTPCQPFNVTVSTDTMVCPEEQVQLHASGGQSYEWQPANGLSCANCANPVLTADSSRLYTVRIWNNDSCSVVRPVMVRVRQKPVFQNVTHTNTACGETTGSIVVKPNTFHTYTLNGSPWQNNATFSNLDAGSYLIQIKDTNGCVNDSTVSIGSTLQTQALFTASPQSGTAPLSVAFTNQSIHATNYEWLINGQSFGNSLSSHTFDTSGTYTVTLIAYNYLPTCADTFSLTLSVADSLVLSIPNIFTPNQDGINDVFSVTSNLDTDYEFSVQNRWGNTMHTSKGKLLKSIPLVLWVGKDATDGVYFYQLKISGIPNREPIEKQGFVTVVR